VVKVSGLGNQLFTLVSGIIIRVRVRSAPFRRSFMAVTGLFSHRYVELFRL